jgi:hypothetical protein
LPSAEHCWLSIATLTLFPISPLVRKKGDYAGASGSHRPIAAVKAIEPSCQEHPLQALKLAQEGTLNSFDLAITVVRCRRIVR